MAAINFDQPSGGTVNDAKDAFSVVNNGAGNALTAQAQGAGYAIRGDGAQTDAVVGFAHAKGKAGVLGLAPTGNAVVGISDNGTGVYGRGAGFGAFFETTTGVGMAAKSQNDSAVTGESQGGFAAVFGRGGKNGVWGYTLSNNDSGVFGSNDGAGNGVAGASKNGIGVRGDSQGGFAGVHGNGVRNGVWGNTASDNDSGVFGSNEGAGNGVAGNSKNGIGVRGDTTGGFAAVHGNGGKNGVWGYTVSEADSGVFGQNESAGSGGRGVAGISKSGIGVYGAGGWYAGYFDGAVWVTGDIYLKGQDCAEKFDLARAEHDDPGTVMIVNDDGALEPCQLPYDKKVAGVISGAGDCKPGIVLGGETSERPKAAIALLGKTYCKVDANCGAIEVGDLLTTSATPGHAMRATDPLKAFGTVIGKALQPMLAGQGLIPILVALQ